MKFSRFILFAFVFLLSHPITAFAGESSIASVEGQVQIIRGSQTLEAKPGMDVREKDILKTAAGSTVDYSVNKVAGVRLNESSEEEITSAKDTEMQIKLKSGKSIINLAKLPAGSKFKVETPTAIAAARGTQFMCAAFGSESSFAVRDGVVDVTTFSTGETFSLNPGQGLDVPQDLVAGALSVRPALGAELTALDQASSIKTC